jgi:hypothetical protein
MPMSKPLPLLRKARTDAVVAVISDDLATLPPGEWFVEQHSDVVKVFGDPSGTRHVADMELVDFLDGLARRDIVFVSWG